MLRHSGTVFGSGRDASLVSNDETRQHVVVGVSGGGRSLRNLVACESQFSSFRVAGVIASSRSCGAQTWAIEQGLPVFYLETPQIEPAMVGELQHWLTNVQCRLIVLAGYLRLFPDTPDLPPTINIHPSLLPKYGGKGMYGSKVHQAVWHHGDRESGATVHWVDGQYDSGQPISQSRVDLRGCKNSDDIADRVFAAEQTLLPCTVDGLLSGRLPLPNRKIFML